MQAYVRQLHKTKWCKNPLSGHEWPEHTPIQKFELGGIGHGWGTGPFFRTFAAAQRACDEFNHHQTRTREILGETNGSTGTQRLCYSTT